MQVHSKFVILNSEFHPPTYSSVYLPQKPAVRNYSLIFLFLLCSFLGWSQNEQLAQNYFQQGAYEKAAATYEALLKQQPGNPSYILSLVETYQQLEAYPKAEALLKSILKPGNIRPDFEVELGYNYQLMDKPEEADQWYEKALESLSQNPRYAYTLGRAFEKHSLLDHAVETYKTAMKANDQLLFDLQLARIYGEQGNIELMLGTYIDMIARDPKFYPTAQRGFSQFITEDPGNSANQIFKKLLLKRSQQNPDLIYNRLLSWLFIQQKEYKKAFAQERAITRRSNGDMQGMINLAGIVLDENKPEITTEILNFIMEESDNPDIKRSAQQKLLEVKVLQAAPEEYPKLKKEYQELLTKSGRDQRTIDLQMAYAHFLAFDLKETENASNFLKTSLNLSLSRFEEAQVKMQLADILVLEEKFGSALIYYSQVQKAVQNDIIAQEARFKVAKTSYYRGDFEWAQTQLKVLKSSATQLIANDAQQLYLLIADNSQEDSTQTALKLYARADLLSYQKKNDAAIGLYDEILQSHKGESIEDEALLAQAKLFEDQNAFAKAEKNYLQLLQFYGQDILADDALFNLAQLYEGPLQNPEKAKEYYERIIFEHEDSIFYVKAQKQFRELRGDAVN